jgi:HEAT repeat protein
MSDAKTLLQRVLDADRALRNARDSFLAIHDTTAMARALGEQIDNSFHAYNSTDAHANLIRISDLLMDIGGPDAARLLLQILGHEEPAVRVAAGESLIELLYERYAEVARVIERVIERNENPVAMAEIPFVLAEVGEPGGIKIISRLLQHSSADVVGAAIEGLAALGDGSVIPSLEKLTGDKRTVTMDEEGEESAEVTIGDLASEAIDHLRAAQGA